MLNNPTHEENLDDVLEAESLEQTDFKKPPLYAVIMYNDDYTPADYVMMVLQEYFNKQPFVAMQITINIHESGRGVVGIYPKDIAETKAKTVNEMARKDGFPLKLDIEEQSSN